MYIRLIILFSFLTEVIIAQSTSSYKEIDSLSFVAFEKNDYSSMKEIVKLAKENEISFYYFHLRAGIVAYNHERYENALIQFEIANQMNPKDTITVEYLYYALLFTNRIEDAESLLSKQDFILQEKLKYNKKKLKSLTVSYMYLSNRNIQDQSKEKMINQQAVAGESSLNGNIYGGNLGLNFLLRHRLSLITQMTYYKTNSSFLEEFNFQQYRKSTAFKNNQFQYNFAGKYTTKKGVVFSGGVGYFISNSGSAYTSYNLGPNNWYTTINSNSYKGNLLNIGIGKRTKMVYGGIAFSSIKLYDDKTNQFEIDLGYFPFQNNKLYLSNATVFINNQTSFIEHLNFKLFKNCWVDLGYCKGNLYNYVSANGLAVYNSADPILQEINSGLNLYFKKLDISLNYSNQIKEGSYFHYDIVGDYTIDKFNYRNNNMIISTRWKF